MVTQSLSILQISLADCVSSLSSRRTSVGSLGVSILGHAVLGQAFKVIPKETFKERFQKNNDFHSSFHGIAQVFSALQNEPN